jgi:hypothetical protein
VNLDLLKSLLDLWSVKDTRWVGLGFGLGSSDADDILLVRVIKALKC